MYVCVYKCDSLSLSLSLFSSLSLSLSLSLFLSLSLSLSFSVGGCNSLWKVVIHRGPAAARSELACIPVSVLSSALKSNRARPREGMGGGGAPRRCLPLTQSLCQPKQKTEILAWVGPQLAWGADSLRGPRQRDAQRQCARLLPVIAPTGNCLVSAGARCIGPIVGFV